MIICRDCQSEFEPPVQRGRKPVRCPTCKAKGDSPKPPVPSEPTPQSSAPPPTEAVSEEQYEKAEHVANMLDLGSVTYQVWVGNLGIAFTSESERDARVTYASYVKKSGEGYGQVGFEPVRLERISGGAEPEVLESYRFSCAELK